MRAEKHLGRACGSPEGGRLCIRADPVLRGRGLRIPAMASTFLLPLSADASACARVFFAVRPSVSAPARLADPAAVLAFLRRASCRAGVPVPICVREPARRDAESGLSVLPLSGRTGRSDLLGGGEAGSVSPVAAFPVLRDGHGSRKRASVPAVLPVSRHPSKAGSA